MQCSHMPTAETVKYERQLHEVGRGNSHLSSNGATVTPPRLQTVVKRLLLLLILVC